MVGREKQKRCTGTRRRINLNQIFKQVVGTRAHVWFGPAALHHFKISGGETGGKKARNAKLESFSDGMGQYIWFRVLKWSFASGQLPQDYAHSVHVRLKCCAFAFKKLRSTPRYRFGNSIWLRRRGTCSGKQLLSRGAKIANLG